MKKRILALLISIFALLGFTGCSSGGVNGQGISGGAGSDAMVSIRGNENIEKGWSYIKNGQYDSAITQFNKVLDGAPTDKEKSDANNGIGWAKSFSTEGRLKDGIKWFTLAKELNDDAKVGLAAAYMQQASKSDMEEVIELLFVDLGKGNPAFEFSPLRPIGVTNAEVHAMLAYAYAATDNDALAHEQLEITKTIKPDYTSSELAQIITATEFLLN